MSLLARRVLRLSGWSLTFTDPGTRRYVLIVAPHTSNWDFVVGLLASWALGLNAHWMGKHSLFRGPLAPLFRALGGIPVRRTDAGDVIRQMVERFANTPDFVLGMAPEGTRASRPYWKSGFWHIARAAGVPVVMASIDWRRKCVGVGGRFVPGDDIEADFALIKDFYADKRGRRPEGHSDICPRPP